MALIFINEKADKVKSKRKLLSDFRLKRFG